MKKATTLKDMTKYLVFTKNSTFFKKLIEMKRLTQKQSNAGMNFKKNS